MIATVEKPLKAATIADHKLFLELAPRIRDHARSAFSHLHAEEREEAISEVLAGAFCAFHRLVQLGKQHIAYASPLARFAIARFRAGRRIGNRLKSGDVFSGVAQSQRGFALRSLHSPDSSTNEWLEVLADDRLTPVVDQVAFRLDFSAWLRTLCRRDRMLARFLAIGNTTNEAARRFGVSKGRISQLRVELWANWRSFQSDAPLWHRKKSN